MQKSRWIIASSVVALAMGFGHAGCYTSGIPGGPAAGGAPSTTSGGQTSDDAGSGGTNAGSGGSDAGEGGTGSEVTCLNSKNCGPNTVCYVTSGATIGTCVECIANADCGSVSNRICNAHTNTCVACLQSNDCGTGQRCVQNGCIAALPCASDKTCYSSSQVCDFANGWCVECRNSNECLDEAKPICSTDEICIAPDSSTDAGDAG